MAITVESHAPISERAIASLILLATNRLSHGHRTALEMSHIYRVHEVLV